MFDRMRMTMMKVKPVNPTIKCEQLNVLSFDWVSIKWHFFGNENIIKKCHYPCSCAWIGACSMLELVHATYFLCFMLDAFFFFYSMLSSSSTRCFLYFLPDASLFSTRCYNWFWLNVKWPIFSPKNNKLKHFSVAKVVYWPVR